jgi:hypothetical protein
LPNNCCVQCSHARTKDTIPNTARNTASTTDPQGTSSGGAAKRRCSSDAQPCGGGSVVSALASPGVLAPQGRSLPGHKGTPHIVRCIKAGVTRLSIP